MSTQPSPATPPDDTGTPARAEGRSLADFGALSPAEQTLLAQCRRADDIILDGGRPRADRDPAVPPYPVAATDRNRVRGDFIRFLILGGDDDHPVYDSGLSIYGAWIDGPVNLLGATVERTVQLCRCHFTARIILAYARLKIIDLSASRLADGLFADGLQCDGSVWLRNADACGPLLLSTANVAGYVMAEGLRIEGAGPSGAAELRCEAIRIGGNLQLQPSVDADPDPQARASRIAAVFSLYAARIGGDLNLSYADFAYVVPDAPAADPTQSFVVPIEARGLIFRLAIVGGSLVVRGMAAIGGVADLGGMTAGILDDDAASWEKADGRLILDGFTYARLAGDAATDETMRQAWLEHQPADDLGTAFKPQPWDQLATVLRAMGHPNRARKIAIARERHVGRVKVNGVVRRLAHTMFGAFAGYGYEPERLVRWLFGLFAGCAAAFALAAQPIGATGAHVFRPAKSAPDLACIVAATRTPPRPCAATDEATFMPIPYSFDRIIPAIGVKYADDWKIDTGVWLDVPGVGRLPLGWMVQVLAWLELVLGWIGTPVLALIAGSILVRKD